LSLYLGHRKSVDIIAHRYDYVKSPDLIEEIYLLSIADIIAMKLNAISTSGQRSKDFIDIYYLLEKYNISSMLDMYKSKIEKEVTKYLKKTIY
jgi:hypothetical protein